MKKNPFISYVSGLTFFSIAVCFVVMLLWLFIPADYIRTAPYYILMYYAVTMSGYACVYFLPKRTKMKFEHLYMMTKIAKFLIYIIVLSVVLVAGIEKNTKFAVAYLILFAVYQIFDTVTLTRLARKKE